VTSTTEKTYTPRVKERYNDELRAQLREQLELASIMQAPTVEKIHYVIYSRSQGWV